MNKYFLIPNESYLEHTRLEKINYQRHVVFDLDQNWRFYPSNINGSQTIGLDFNFFNNIVISILLDVQVSPTSERILTHHIPILGFYLRYFNQFWVFQQNSYGYRKEGAYEWLQKSEFWQQVRPYLINIQNFGVDSSFQTVKNYQSLFAHV